LTAADTLDGGGGNDSVELSGDYSGPNAVVFSATTMTNVETLLLDAGNSYDLTTDDATVANGATLVVDASVLGSSDFLTFDGSAETDGHFHFIAGAGLQTILTGGAQSDTFDLTQAAPLGDVEAYGGGGDDTFQFLDNFDSSGQIVDGGSGTNTLSLDGDYSGISLVGGVISNIQDVVLAGGHSYTGVQIFDDVSGGAATTIDATALLAGDALSLDASASSDALLLNAGAGTYTITGSTQDDTFNMGADFSAADSIDGGAGNDTVTLDGDYSAAPDDLGGLFSVETISVAAGHSYDLVSDDVTVGSGQTLTVDASALGAGDSLTFDGSAETDGQFIFTAGAGDNMLTGGAQSDSFDLSAGGNNVVTGGGGADVFTAGSGIETFVYNAASESTGPGYDTIAGFDASKDMIQLTGIEVAGLTEFTNRTVSAATFDNDINNAIGADSLTGQTPVIITTDASGDIKNQTLLIVDANGDDHYDSGSDYIIDITGYSGTLTAANFTDGGLVINGDSGDNALTGGAESDHINGMAGNDTITGGGGRDILTGGAGADTFVYNAASDSTGLVYDSITDFNAAEDFFHFAGVTVTSVNIEGTHDLSAGTFAADINSVIGADELSAQTPVVFSSSGVGDIKNQMFLVVDVDGNHHYDTGTDYVVNITGLTGTITASDFI
ncbi:MAG TPA: calcium-binding protein, partial [Gemmatimonadaceae bacterium]|nr:calcium-binding protein [Gemmatimonadaceae bacterium]